jgi:hypothetical protein
MIKKKLPTMPLIIGWREWLMLPQLNIDQIKVKIDTGAKTSSLHAFDIHIFETQGKAKVSFKVHPYQRETKHTIIAEADLIEKRYIRSSTGHLQLRPVIQTMVQLGEQKWLIDVTLTNRDVMGFRMLLGRQAIKKRFLVNPNKSFLLSNIVMRD